MVNDGIFWKEIKSLKSAVDCQCNEIKELKNLIIEYKTTNLHLEEEIRGLKKTLKTYQVVLDPLVSKYENREGN